MSCAQALSTPEGRAGRAVEAQQQVAKSVDDAEHSSTLQGAMADGLSTSLTKALRRALHDVQMHLLNNNEKCGQSARVIRSKSPLDPRRLQRRDRGDVDAPRTITGNGVGDRQEMA